MHNHSSLTFRKDIQGLRALAVLLVIAAHAKIPGVQGGFIGVDVFFVISGYLITGLLLKELTTDNSINFLRFYVRRLKRLFPALAFVIVTSAFFAYKILPTQEQLPQAVSAATAALWVSNLHFTFQNLDYFGAQAEDNIYLHTWSLGVEEQFYLIWPLFLFTLFFLAKKTKNFKTILISALTLMALISFFLCAWQTQVNSKAAFYLTPFRAWQFCIGGLVFVLADKFTFTQKYISSVIALLGLLFIVASAFFLKSSTPYPGIYALIPTIGTALIIFSKNNNLSNLSTMLLENPIAQSLGNISYSWYLWHWPVLILGNLFFPLDTLFNQLLLIGVSWILALATYRLIENPIRLNTKLFPSHGWQATIALSISFAIVLQSFNWQSRIHKNLAFSKDNNLDFARVDLPIIYSMGCDDWFHSSTVKICEFGNSDTSKHVIMMGDSIGLQWFPVVLEGFSNQGWRISVMTKSACPMINTSFFYERIGREYTECSEWRAAALDLIQQLKPDILIMGSAHYNLKQEQWKEGKEQVLNTISNHVKTIYIIRPTPTLPFDSLSCLSAQSLKGLNAESCSTEIDLHANESAWQQVSAAAKNYPNVYLIDMNEDVCPEKKCYALRGNVPTYRDSMHLTASFVRSLSSNFFKKMIDTSSFTHLQNEKTP